MSTTSGGPLLTLGLPVYNGEEYLREALDSLLAQTFTDFELIVSDNASTDSSPAIVEEYAARDARIRFVRQPRNMGGAFNHNVVIDLARGAYFKWVAHDDVYAPDLLQRCMDAFRERPELATSHSWTAIIDERGEVTHQHPYHLDTDTPRASDRFRSLLYGDGGDDIYGIIPMAILNRIQRYGSFHHADRTFVAELALHGPFGNVPAFLYFRREHGQRVTLTKSVKRRSTTWDPRRASVWHPRSRLIGEYLLSFVASVARAPLSLSERMRCYRHLLVWVLRHGPRVRYEEPGGADAEQSGASAAATFEAAALPTAESAAAEPAPAEPAAAEPGAAEPAAELPAAVTAVAPRPRSRTTSGRGSGAAQPEDSTGAGAA